MTAGPTREHFDPVGSYRIHLQDEWVSLAYAAWERGADVTLISGPTSLAVQQVKSIRINTTEELLSAVKRELPNTNMLVMAAAPPTFGPKPSMTISKRRGQALQI